MKSIYDIEVCSNDESTSVFPLYIQVLDAPVAKTFVYLACYTAKHHQKPGRNVFFPHLDSGT